MSLAIKTHSTRSGAGPARYHFALDKSQAPPAGFSYPVDHAASEGGGQVMTGTCVSCGMTDVEVNEQSECADCAGEAAVDEEEE